MDIFSEFSSPEKNLEKLIHSFYTKKVMKSKHIIRYFDGKDIEKLIRNMCNSMYSIFREKDENFLTQKENLKTFHKTFNITNEDFDVYKGLFGITMREMSYSEELISYTLYNMEQLREFIVSHKSYAEVFGNSQKETNLIAEVRKRTKENIVLQVFFGKLPPAEVETHQKRIINYIFGTTPFTNEDQCAIYR